MGIKITTDGKPVKVWRNDKNGFPKYAVRLGTKEGDEWVNIYQDVKFCKGVELENGALIHIKNAWPKVDSWTKDGRQFTKEVWFINEFEYDGINQAPPKSFDSAFDDFGFSSVEDNVPFR